LKRKEKEKKEERKKENQCLRLISRKGKATKVLLGFLLFFFFVTNPPTKQISSFLLHQMLIKGN